MLSTAAERTYWLGRYLERAENLSRIIRAYSTLLFDLPKGTYIGWSMLLDITGSNKQFEEAYTQADERSIMKFLLTDLHHHSSLISILRSARENARTTREVIPSEAWEHINNLYLQVKEIGQVHISRTKRNSMLNMVVDGCQQLTGILSGSMSHNDAHCFIYLGSMLERADMTTRIADVGSISFLPQLASNVSGREYIQPYESIIWMNVLRCLSGYQAYRQSVHNRVSGEEVVRFLLQDEHFPRSLKFCLNDLSTSVERLPSNENVLRAVARVSRICKEVDIDTMLRRGVLVQFIDELQISIADIHEELSATWFSPA